MFPNWRSSNMCKHGNRTMQDHQIDAYMPVAMLLQVSYALLSRNKYTWNKIFR